MPNLRGHHLICLQFYHGEGYDESFIRKLKDVIELANKETVTISRGSDDVCNTCPFLKKGKCVSAPDAEKDIQKMDIKALALLGYADGQCVEWSEVKERVKEIFSDWYFQYCSECKWKTACDKDEHFQKLIKDI